MINPFIIAISIFIIFVLFNLYIRVRTFKLYRQLVQRRIQFQFKDLFYKERWQKIEQAYPNDLELLTVFRKHMMTTGLLFAIVILVVLILLFVMRNMSMA